MPINEYDDLATKTFAKGGDAPNPYEDSAGAIVQDTKQDLQSAMFVAVKKDPEREAKVQELSRKTNLPADIVERQFDKIKQRQEIANPDYETLIEKSPAFSKWLKDPNNASVAHDDIENLQKVESSVQDYTFMRGLKEDFHVGLANLNSSIAKVPALAVDLALLPGNTLAKAMDRPDLQVKSPDWLSNNPLTKFYDSEAQAHRTEELGRSVSEEIGKGNYSRAARSLVSQFVSNAPQQAMTIGAMIASGGAAGFATAFATTGATALRSARDKGVDPQAAGMDALLQGGFEAGFESVGTFSLLHHWEGAIAKSYGKETSRAVMKDFFKTIAYSVAGEGNEEALTSVAQDLSDHVTGVDKDTIHWEGIGRRALDAGIVGGFSGGLMTGPTAIGSGVIRQQQIKDAALARDFYISLGDSVEATKLRKRSPEATKSLVNEITKDGPVKDIFIPVEDFETYFQKVGKNPAQIAQEIGISKQLDEAKQTGGDIQVPLAQWVDKVLGTEHYKGLSDSVKFHPEDLTATQAVTEKETLDKELQAQVEQAKAQEPEAQIKEVVKDVQAQLKESGLDPKQGEILRGIAVLAQREGLDPMEFYKSLNLNIGRGEQAAVPGEQVLNQSAYVKETPNDVRQEFVDFLRGKGKTITHDQLIFPHMLKEAGAPEDMIGRLKEYNDPKNAPVQFAKVFREELQTYHQEDGTEGPRGQIRLGENSINIDILEKADRSTFFHETGHLYLEVLGRLAEREGATEETKADMQKLLDWFGVESSDKITTEHHEQFARGFEKYIGEGVAPTKALRKTFNRFKLWILSVYQNLSNLNVNLTDDVRDVFSRMLAGEESVQAAEVKLHQEPLFIEPSKMGMNDAQAAKYIEAREEARMFAEEKVTEKLMRDLNRKKSAEYTAKREEIAKAIEAQVNETNVYKAQEALKNDNTLQPIELAEAFGFKNAEDVLKHLSEAPKKEDLINQKTDEQMAQLYPDLMNTGALPEETIKAIHNEKRAQLLRMELQHLASNNMPVLKDVIRRTVKRVPSEQAVRSQAEQIISARKISDIKPNIFQRAEVKAAREAGVLLAKGDIDGAFDAKRRELLNHELYRASVEASDSVENHIEKFKKMFRADEKISKTRDADMVNAARAVLAQFGLARPTEKTAEQYLSQIKQYDEDSYNVVKSLVDSAAEHAGPYKDVSYDDFADMADSVNALWDLAKSSKEIEIDGKRVSREEIQGKLQNRLSEIVKPGERAGYTKAVTTWEKTKIKFLGAKAALTRVEHWADTVDGHDAIKGGPRGPFHSFMFQPISDAVTKYRLKKSDVMTQYESIAKEYSPNITHGEITASEIGYTFRDKTELVMALLHTGNESNQSKLIRGRNWGSMDETGVVDTSRWNAFIARAQSEGTLTKADYDFAQKVWDLMESLKPEAQKAHKQMYGHYFNEITFQEIETPFGKYKGGYVPAKVDTYTNEDASIRQEREEFEKNNNSFQFPTTGRGFTKSRVDAYAAPLSLELGLLGGHIDSVMRFSYIEPRVKEVARVVMNKEFRANLAQLDPTIAKEALVPWLQRAAQQKVVLPSESGEGKLVDVAASFLRRSVAMQIMVGNFTNAAQQFTGMVVAMSKVRPKYIRNGLVTYIGNIKETTNSIMEKSEYMRSTQGSNIYETQQAIQEIVMNPSTFESMQNFALKHTYFLQSGTQNIVNTVVWMGAYEQAIVNKMDEANAVKEADSAVRLTQGTNNAEDISRFETGTATKRLFTQFAGYFNMLTNLNAGEITKISRELGLKKGAGKMFYVYATAFMIPAVLSEIIVKAMAGELGGGGDDDDEAYQNQMLSVFFGSQFKTATAMIPWAGQLLTSGYNRFNNKQYDDRLSISPVISTLETAVGVPALVYKAITDDLSDGAKKRLVKDTLMLMGTASSLPFGPVGRPAGYLMDVDSGRAEPKGPVDFTRGILSGRPGTN